jgi:hypothetical protein
MKLLEDGTVRSYISGQPTPIRFFTPTEVVDAVAVYKRLFLLIFENIEKQGWIGRFITLIALWLNWKIIPVWFTTFFGKYPILLKEKHYSQPVKEVRRVLLKYLDINIVNPITLVLEMDSAYRYRFQDVFAEYAGDPLHLFDLLIARDYDVMREKWAKIKKLTKLAFKIPKVKKFITGILNEMNIDEIKMNHEDIYETNQFDSYQYRGLSFMKRQEENYLKYGKSVEIK